MSERFKFTEEEQEIIARSQAAGNLTPSSLAAPAGSAEAIERAITALTYRADSLEKAVNDRPGAAIASIMAEGIKNDRKAIAVLTEMLQQNDQAQRPLP